MPRSWREALARKLEGDLQRHVKDAWFDRTIDPAGGFLCDFDRRWRSNGPHDRMLEFQARQTRTAARIGLAYPSEPRWPAIARHGLSYLRDVMRDATDGGWYWRVDRQGHPLVAGSKHAHGTAYVIDACVEVFRLTGDVDALEMAKGAFEWLEKNLHDSIHGGYFGWATRSGNKILGPADLPSEIKDRSVEPLGHAIGHKDANVHSDLLEAFWLLLDVWPERRLRGRLEEVHELLLARFLTSGGSMNYLLYPDLTPVPTVQRHGYPLQTALRLTSVASTLGGRVDAMAMAHNIADNVFEVAWDSRGGVIEAGPAAAPFQLAGYDLRVPVRSWWIQTEALKLLLLLGFGTERAGHYRALFDRLLGVVDGQFLDTRHGGWYAVARGDQRPWARSRGRGTWKGHAWKDASHEADFYLTAVRILRGLPTTAGLETPT